MSSDLDRINQFLRYANTIPAVGDLVAALHHGPLALSECVCSTLFRILPDGTLEIVAHVGLPDEFYDRYRHLPASSPLTAPRAARERVITSADIGSAPDDPLGQVDYDHFESMTSCLGVRSMIAVPVLHGGTAIAVIGILSSRPIAASRPHFEALAAAASVVSLWLRHPDTRLPPPVVSAPKNSLLLTPRQRQVLLLLGEGATIDEAAVALGYSPSTIKHDLRRATEATRTTDRAEALDRARRLGLM